jgi:hypothetical protein|tara:strand:+ start:213 stop:434 length:222 start_codon:yes stop_codon:yes gene_type:complete
MNIDLKSSVTEKSGQITTQIIHFVGGEKRTFNNIISTSIRQGQFTKFYLKDGTWVMVNDKNVLCIEVFEEKDV